MIDVHELNFDNWTEDSPKAFDLDWDDIKALSDWAWMKPIDLDDVKKPKKDEVFDEDKSVKWNREEYGRRLKAYNEARIAAFDERNKRRQIHDDVVVYLIQHEFHDMPREVAKSIFNMVWDKDHATDWNPDTIYSDVQTIAQIWHAGYTYAKTGKLEDFFY